ncbi:plasmid mobilization relaxosome protein MobC [bacterium]|nr:MAG: plasmid mobilization relaxosome protein MobC [bacterium]
MKPEKKQYKRSTGRNKKPAADVKSIIHTVRFTEQENTELLVMVETLETTVSHFLRAKALGAKSQVVNGVNLISSLDKIGADLSRAGNNINQLARHANTLNKVGKVDESVMNRFNVLFADYIVTKREIQVALRKIIREIRG